MDTNHKMSDLDNISWNEIAECCMNGKAEEVFELGAFKTIHISHSDCYISRLVGFYHDKDIDGKTIPTSWLITSSISKDERMCNIQTNTKSWSRVHKLLDDEIFYEVDESLAHFIRPAIKLTSSAKGGKFNKIERLESYLWIPSEVEFFGKANFSSSGEGKQYEYFKSGDRSCIPTPYCSPFIWTRSPAIANRKSFVCINKYGYPCIDDANHEHGIAFGFCI